MRKNKEKMEADQKRAKKRGGEKSGRSTGAKPLQNGDGKSGGAKSLQNGDGKSAGAAKKGVSAVGKPVKREKPDAAEKGIRAKGIRINDGVMTQNEPDAALSAHTVIIGAGASGLAAAIFAGRNSDVLVVDGNDRVGRKLYATGNGRCNFTNDNCSSDDYNQAADGFIDEVFDVFSPKDTLRLF